MRNENPSLYPEAKIPDISGIPGDPQREPVQTARYRNAMGLHGDVCQSPIRLRTGKTRNRQYVTRINFNYSGVYHHEMHLVTLIENTSTRNDLVAQHGLSLYIESHGKRLLFDMGQDGSFLYNAEKLGIDISKVDYAILSHGHYDHCGGLSSFLDTNSSAPIYLGSGSDKPFYSEKPKKYRYIGLDARLLEENAERVRWVSKSCEIDSGIHLLSDFHMGESRPGGNRWLLTREGDEYKADPFAHEILLVIQDPDGIVLATGCGHSGILNMVLAAKKYFPGIAIKAVIGGFHLIGERPLEVERITQRLIDLECKRVITGHCTGEEAGAIMEEMLDNRFDHLSCGYSIDL